MRKTYVDEKQSFMVSRSWLTLALPENLAKLSASTING